MGERGKAGWQREDKARRRSDVRGGEVARCSGARCGKVGQSGAAVRWGGRAAEQSVAVRAQSSMAAAREVDHKN